MEKSKKKPITIIIKLNNNKFSIKNCSIYLSNFPKFRTHTKQKTIIDRDICFIMIVKLTLLNYIRIDRTTGK